MASGGLLAGRYVLVTGAAGDIGKAICEVFAEEGAVVAGFDVRGADGVKSCDVTSEHSVTAAFAAAAERSSLTDVVHAAGIVSLCSVAELDHEQLVHELDVNLVGSFLVSREAARYLGVNTSLTLVSSQAGLRGGALWSAYSAAKAGMLRLVECLAEELGPRGVRVNAICPGNVRTAMSETVLSEVSARTGRAVDEVRADYERGVPLGRFAEPREIANVCVFLASRLASYITGTSLVVDGGELSA